MACCMLSTIQEKAKSATQFHAKGIPKLNIATGPRRISQHVRLAQKEKIIYLLCKLAAFFILSTLEKGNHEILSSFFS